MGISKFQIMQAIKLIEKRLGLSASTLDRIDLGDLLTQVSSGDPHNFLRLLQDSGEDSPAWQGLIFALAIGETYFLRDKKHFRILREDILPRLILRRRQTNDLRLSIWCLGCSTGEEAYSVATTLYETIPDLDRWRINLYATDINQGSIDIAQQGIYRDWSFRHTPDAFKQGYFTQVAEGWQISSHIRKMVSFKRLNALGEMPSQKIDIIFARHILMYLSPDNAIRVEGTIHKALANGGWLIMGQSEELQSSRDNWMLHMFPGTAIYQKIDPTETLPESVSYPERKIADQIADDSGEYEQAVVAIQADLPDVAEQHLLALLDTHPRHPKAHILLAAIFANRKLYAEALMHVELALENSGLYADAHYIRALVQLEQDQEESAIQSFSAAIYCQRKHALAAMMLGNTYQGRGNVVKAARHWRNALIAVNDKADDEFVSEISDMTVARLRGMIHKRQALIDGIGSE